MSTVIEHDTSSGFVNTKGGKEIHKHNETTKLTNKAAHKY